MPHPVGEALRTLARWAVAASLGVPSCIGYYDGSSTSPLDIDIDEPSVAAVSAVKSDVWQPIPCVDYHKQTFANPVALRRPFDYLAIYASISDAEMPRGAWGYHLASVGTRCGTSSDRTACDVRLYKLEQANPECAMSRRKCRTFAVAAQGDDARRIDDLSELMRVLGAIETPEKLLLAALWHGMFVPCGGRPEDNTTRFKHPDHWYIQTRWDACPGLRERTLQIADDGQVVSDNDIEIADTHCDVGRRPDGLQPLARVRAASALGRHFVQLAQLEAASVCAFERIAGELRAFDAPDRLALAADAAARDEVSHAHAMAALARRFGAEPSPPQIEPRSRRSLFEFALDNVVEGCVRETFGAVLAHCQAALAQDPAVAATMTRIAEDEMRHAELSWQIAAWIEPRLSFAERGMLAVARRGALAQLDSSRDRALSAADRRVIGWPDAPIVAAARERLAAICDESRA